MQAILLFVIGSASIYTAAKDSIGLISGILHSTIGQRILARVALIHCPDADCMPLCGRYCNLWGRFPAAKRGATKTKLSVTRPNLLSQRQLPNGSQRFQALYATKFVPFINRQGEGHIGPLFCPNPMTCAIRA
jgi:hypothetical protein